jgi:murein L,D-transpeptidase YcbB/YkuD
MKKIFLLLPLLILGCSSQPKYKPVVSVQPKVQSPLFIPSGDLLEIPVPDWDGVSEIDRLVQSVVENYNPDVDNSFDTALSVSDEERFIVVNLPSQTLRAFENGREVLRSRIIIGKPSTPTPTQRSTITSIKLNPDWHAPPRGGIERTYTQMLNRGEADKLRSIHIDWRRRSDGSYQFFQRPGENNVLGRVKFEMYSPSNTYLHDTNRPDLFNLDERLISFGCIRVQKWDELAAWLMGVSKYELMDITLSTNETKRVNIDKTPIYIVYWKTETIDGQTVNWPDVYNKGE